MISKMNICNDLLKLIKNKTELQNSLKGFSDDVKYTFKECYDWCFNPNLIFTNNNKGLLFKIDSVCDFLQDELNTGHWSEVPLSIRRAFTSASYIKALIILSDQDPDSSINGLKDALKCLDLGLLLGAPLYDEDLLVEGASVLSKELSLHSCLDDKDVDNKRKSCNDYEDIFNSLPGEEIQTVECPSIETFNDKYFIPQIPVKLKSCITHWPANKKWLDINYFLKVAGDRTVPIEIGSRYTDESWTQKLMSLKDFIKKYYLRNSSGIGYLAQHNLFDQITELRNDICTPDYCSLSRNYENSGGDPDVNAWFGPKGTVSPLHYDPKDNLLAQVYGVKQILLFSPKDSENLYPHKDMLLFNTAQIDPVHPDLSKFPNYSNVKPYKCLLEDGEVLYMPPKWWHHVTALDNSFSVSFWW